MSHRLYLTLFFLIVSACSLLAQQRVFHEASLVDVVKYIESKTTLIFNYDPALLSIHSYSGAIKINDLERGLEVVFYNTPFSYEFTSKSVVVFLPEKNSYRVCGYVKDKLGESPLLLANIIADDRVHGTQTDENGFFDFILSAHKHQKITISYLGYVSESMMVQELDTVNCNEFLLELDENLFGSEIIVTDYVLSGITEGESYGGISMDYERLSSDHTNIEQDVLKTVQFIPGVTTIDESATNLQIRGGTTDQNLILWEGATLYGPGHFFGMLSSVNPFVIDQVKVYKGIFDPNYDHRVGGIVDMSLSDSVENKFQGGVGTTFSETHAFLKLPVLQNKLSVLASGRKTINESFNSPTLINYSAKVFQDTKVSEDVDEETAQGLDYFDWNLKLLFRPNDQLLFKSSYFKAVNDFNFTAPLYEDELVTNDDVRFDSEVLSFSTQVRFLDNWETHLGWTNSNYENDYSFSISDIEDDELTFSNKVFNNIKDRTFIISNKVWINDEWEWQLGYDYNHKEVNFFLDVFSEFEREAVDSNLLVGRFHNCFSSVQFQRNNWQMNVGLRANYYKEATDWGFSPRFNLQYSFSENIKFKFSTGILQQYISQLKEFGYNELGLNNPVWVLSKSETETIQEAKKIAGGFVLNNRGWLFDVEAYYNKTEGLSTLSPLFVSDVAIYDIAPGRSISRGLDLLLKKNINNYHFWINYSLGKVDFRFPEIRENSFSASNDQRHNLSVINSWRYKDFYLSLSYQYRTGLPFSEPVGWFSEEDDEGGIYYEIEFEELNSRRLKDYSRLDMSLRYKPTFQRIKMRSEFAFSIMNLLNQENIFSRSFYLDDLNEDGQVELFSIDKILLKRTPQLLIRFYW